MAQRRVPEPAENLSFARFAPGSPSQMANRMAAVPLRGAVAKYAPKVIEKSREGARALARTPIAQRAASEISEIRGRGVREYAAALQTDFMKGLTKSDATLTETANIAKIKGGATSTSTFDDIFMGPETKVYKTNMSRAGAALGKIVDFVKDSKARTIFFNKALLSASQAISDFRFGYEMQKEATFRGTGNRKIIGTDLMRSGLDQARAHRESVAEWEARNLAPERGNKGRAEFQNVKRGGKVHKVKTGFTTTARRGTLEWAEQILGESGHRYDPALDMRLSKNYKKATMGGRGRDAVGRVAPHPYGGRKTSFLEAALAGQRGPSRERARADLLKEAQLIKNRANPEWREQEIAKLKPKTSARERGTSALIDDVKAGNRGRIAQLGAAASENLGKLNFVQEFRAGRGLVSETSRSGRASILGAMKNLGLDRRSISARAGMAFEGVRGDGFGKTISLRLKDLIAAVKNNGWKAAAKGGMMKALGGIGDGITWMAKGVTNLAGKGIGAAYSNLKSIAGPGALGGENPLLRAFSRGFLDKSIDNLEKTIARLTPVSYTHL
tara:strand:+ start:85 stop:1755 length:1671 start_codon:yes stop_codon:yes gene_type:complete